MNLFSKQILTHRLWNTCGFQRKQVGGGGGDGLGVWDGNAIKLGCDDHCTTINVIKLIKIKKKRIQNRNIYFNSQCSQSNVSPHK